MRKEKEKLKFLQNVSEKFKTLDEQKKKTLSIIAIIIIALVIITIISSTILGNLVGSAGKVAGNLKNNGFAVEKGNKLYISNTVLEAKNKGLYEIDSKNNAKLIDENSYVKSINLYKGNLYYLAINISKSGTYTRQVVKMKPNGDKKEILVDNIETTLIDKDTLNVSDGWVYFLNSDSKLEKVKINNKNKRQPVSDEKISYFQISGKYIYYTTTDDEFKRMKKNGSSIEKIGNGIDSFQIVENTAYYISKADQHLTKLDVRNNKETTVVDKKVKTFNVYDKTIYYAVNENDEQAIYKMKINGKGNKKIVDLTNSNVIICVTKDWIYYTDKVEDSPYDYTIYKIKTNGKDKKSINI